MDRLLPEIPDDTGPAFPGYRVERELGSGGMATVYVAEDLKHHRRVALKVIAILRLRVARWATRRPNEAANAVRRCRSTKRWRRRSRPFPQAT